MSNKQQWSVRYRPQTLEEFVGQKTAVAYLKGLEKTSRIPGCILISGQSGTGKTTLARLAACRFSGWKGDPDDNPDVIELFANVDSGKDDVKHAIEQSRYSPKGGKRRCMIADEAHAYTGQAASALLKACEEPPPKTTWILCTDRPEKLPRQLAMRAAKISLTEVADEDLIQLMNWILKEEKISLGEKQKLILKKIAESAYGIPREAVQLLDLTATAVKGGAQPSAALKMAVKSGSSTESFETALTFIENYIEGNTNELISIIHASNSEGVVELMLQMIVSLVYKANGQNPKVGLGWAVVKGYKGNCGKNELNSLLQLQSKLISAVQMRIASNYSVSTESLLLSLVRSK